jgi:hypothetical protein
MGVMDGTDFFNMEVAPEELDFIEGVGFLVADRVTCDREKLYLTHAQQTIRCSQQSFWAGFIPPGPSLDSIAMWVQQRLQRCDTGKGSNSG